MNKRGIPIAIILIALMLLLLFSQFSFPWREKMNLKEESIEVSGIERTYFLHVPPKMNGSLLIALHGGGGSGKSIARLTGFNELADERGFLVAYPNALRKHWNDGRGINAYYSQRGEVDDVSFISKLIDHLIEKYNLDDGRVYVAGFSNGAMMAYRIACEIPERIAAIACVSGSMPKSLNCPGKSPISVLIIHGLQDPIVPWKGGELTTRSGVTLGEVLPIPEVVEYWTLRNGCSEKEERYLPDLSEDGTRVKVTRYLNPETEAEVVLYAIEGGGHTWPGGSQYLPERIIGRTCMDFDASEAILNFFERHHK